MAVQVDTAAQENVILIFSYSASSILNSLGGSNEQGGGGGEM